jgi:hypothetical protein
MTNLFMSHSWAPDENGRCNHERVKKLSTELKKCGWTVWLDEENLHLGSNIDFEMANGIQNADAICVCITQSYVEKVNAQNNNCSKEWNLTQSLSKKIIPLIMEQKMLNTKNWPKGIMSMYMMNVLYLDCSSNDIISIVKKLSKMLEILNLKKKIKQQQSFKLRRDFSSINKDFYLKYLAEYWKRLKIKKKPRRQRVTEIFKI